MDKKLKLIKDEEEQKSILKLCELGVITNKILYEPIIFNNKNKKDEEIKDMILNKSKKN